MNKFFHNKPIIISLAVIILLFIMIFINMIYCNSYVQNVEYKIRSDKTDASFKFVLLADLHNKEFGKDNCDLIDKVKKSNPDFIAVSGDMVIRYSDDISNMKNVLSKLNKIVPTYCCLGNHERDLSNKIDFKAEIDSTGAVLFDNKMRYISVNGGKILIGGLTDYPYYEEDAPLYDTDNRHFWESFNKASKSQYSILLHHQPEYINTLASHSNVDLILCGHTHGGLVRIPYFGGVYVPNQGFFGKYDRGFFDFNGTNMIITSGLGTSNFLPRINNPAEICTIYVN